MSFPCTRYPPPVSLTPAPRKLITNQELRPFSLPTPTHLPRPAPNPGERSSLCTSAHIHSFSFSRALIELLRHARPPSSGGGHSGGQSSARAPHSATHWGEVSSVSPGRSLPPKGSASTHSCSTQTAEAHILVLKTLPRALRKDQSFSSARVPARPGPASSPFSSGSSHLPGSHRFLLKTYLLG